MNMSGVLSPENDTFSTPPTTPNVPMESIAPSLSRRSSRPTSLSIDQASWRSDIVLEESSPQLLRKPNGVVSPPAVAHDRTVTPRSSTTDMPSTGAPEHARPNHKPMDSPCFVHSQLDKGASLTEWLRNRQHAQGDVGVARSLQQQDAAQTIRDQESPDTSYPSSSLSSFESDFGEDDDFRGSLTKQLAETAVSVREMSKQLGRARVHSNIQSILIVTKARDNRLIQLTRQLALYLMLKRQSGQKRGMVVYVDSQLRHSRRFDAEGIRRDYPELFQPFPRRRASSNSVSSLSSLWEKGDDTSTEDEGQLRYWTSSMCSRSPHLFDFVVTLGGDGTVLFTSWLFQRIVPPVLSFALGSLGFLTNFDFAKYQEVMDTAIDSGIRVNLRMRFTCTVYRAVTNEEGKSRKAVKRGQTGEILMNNLEKGGWEALEDGWCSAPPGEAKLGKDKEIMCFTTRPVETFEVLNDLVVDRGPSPYVSLLELFGDEHHMTTVQADGLTVSTPTGSTAYSLSAGGSLVHPEIPALLITPICPHTLSFRPMLLPDSMELRICVPYNSRSTAWASFDGRGRIELKQGDHIKVAASKYPFPTVCADKQSTDWFHAISRTLKWNERERQKSFVVVEEEGPARHKRRSKRDTLTSEQLKSPINEIPDEEEDEVSDDEDDTFDIDDSSSEATTLNPASVANNLTSEEERLGKEKVHDMLLENALDNALKKGQRKRSKSRQRSSSSGLRSGVDSPSRFAGQPPHPPAISPRHMYNGNSSDLEAPKLAQHHAAEIQAPGLDTQLHKVLAHTREKEGDVENIKTPTAYTLVHGKMRTEPRIRPQEQHGHRAFAVWGQDESDSNASDSDV